MARRAYNLDIATLRERQAAMRARIKRLGLRESRSAWPLDLPLPTRTILRDLGMRNVAAPKSLLRGGSVECDREFIALYGGGEACDA